MVKIAYWIWFALMGGLLIFLTYVGICEANKITETL